MESREKEKGQTETQREQCQWNVGFISIAKRCTEIDPMFQWTDFLRHDGSTCGLSILNWKKHLAVLWRENKYSTNTTTMHHIMVTF